MPSQMAFATHLEESNLSERFFGPPKKKKYQHFLKLFPKKKLLVFHGFFMVSIVIYSPNDERLRCPKNHLRKPMVTFRFH